MSIMVKNVSLQAETRHKSIILNGVYRKKTKSKQTNKNSVIDWEQCPVIKNSLTKLNFTFPVAKDEIHPTCFGHTS